MLERIIIIALLVFGIYCTMQDEMIFEKLGNWIEETLIKNLGKDKGEFWYKPLGGCVVCFTFWMGGVLYLALFRVGVVDGLVTVIAAMGLNYILTRLFTD